MLMTWITFVFLQMLNNIFKSENKNDSRAQFKDVKVGSYRPDNSELLNLAINLNDERLCIIYDDAC